MFKKGLPSLRLRVPPTLLCYAGQIGSRSRPKFPLARLPLPDRSISVTFFQVLFWDLDQHRHQKSRLGVTILFQRACRIRIILHVYTRTTNIFAAAETGQLQTNNPSSAEP